ncbi:MAG: adenylate/guanylate cyclase domain-containing protein [Spirochaetes bacterium]|nr:adenylate/guanylate cyclase domain-containing protein [Spirochaetota bacterium]
MAKKKKSRLLNDKTTFSFVFITILTAIILFAFFFNIFEIFENKIIDFRFKYFNQNKKPSKDLVFINIDDESLTELSKIYGTWPWPRGTVITQSIMDYILIGSPAAFLFDIIYSEYSPGNFDDFIYYKENNLIPEEDRILVDQSSIYNTVSHGVRFYGTGEKDDMPAFTENNFSLSINDTKSNIKFHDYPGFLSPFPELFEESKNFHSVTCEDDLDGVTRKYQLLIHHNNKYYPSLALEGLILKYHVHELILNGRTLILKCKNNKEIRVPLDENGDFQINFYKDTLDFENINATAIIASQAQLFNGEDPLISFEEFQDKIIIFGASALGLKDIKTSPVAKNYAGPFIHMNTMSNIIEQHYIKRVPRWGAVIIIIFSILMIVLTTTFLKKKYIKNILGSSYILLHILLTMIFFKYFGIILELATTLTASVISYFGALIFLSLTEEKDKKFLKETFGSYLAPELIDDMFSNKTMPELGGESRQITAYFTDIQSFSTFSEKLTAVQLVELLNEYLSAMTDILLKHKGTLDKYEGDAIIAFIGAPIRVEDHPLRACQIAVSMQNKLLKLRKKWSSEKQLENESNRNTKNMPTEEWTLGYKWPKVVHQMKMRIGINTGEIVVGNMGSAVRMNYTMMGDSVNLAARLEAGAKQYGVYTIASEFTMKYEFPDENGNMRKVKEFLDFRYIDKIIVVGKSEPVKVYEVVAMKGEATQKEQELFKFYNEGIKLYLSRKWDNAILKLKDALKIERVPDGKTTPSEVYIKRCLHFKKNPPPANWDGTWVLTSK